jgi:hypothetical protein
MATIRPADGWLDGCGGHQVALVSAVQAARESM